MRFTTKIFIYIFLTSMVAFGGLIIVIHLWLVNHTLKENIRQEKELIALVAIRSEDFILRKDPVELYKFYQSVLALDSYIDYIFSVTENGIEVHTFKTGVPKGLLHLGPLDLSEPVDMIPIEKDNGELIYHLRTKIGVLPQAVLHAGISDKRMKEKLIPLRNRLIVAGGIVVVLIPLLLALILSILISRPFALLRQAVHKIGAGELNYRLSAQVGTEFEPLMNDINTMADKLEKLRNGLEGEIEERKLAESGLSKQTELLNTILNHLPHGIFWKDTSFKLLGCNKGFAQAAGFNDPAQVIGKTDHELPWEKEESDFFVQCDEKVIRTGEPLIDIEEHITLSNGQEKTIVTNKVPLKDQDGVPYGVLGIFYDVTDRKRMEEAIKQTQKMEAIGTLAGGIAHDFNNILSGIIGYTELARDEIELREPSHTYLKQVLKSAARAKELIRQILTFSRKSQEERKPIRMAAVANDEAKLLRSTLPTTIDIRMHIEDQDGMVNADPTQMHQVVMNLCTNAADAMRQTGGVLDISLSRVDMTEESIKHYHDVVPGPYMELKVSDTGHGIDSRIIHRIFEPFFTTKEMEKGTGMGLAVVHGIIKDHGGDIIVESQVGKGTTFTVLFPRAVTHTKEKKEQTTPIPTGNEQILMVDDEALLLDLGEKMLTSLGYKVTAVSGSLKALELFEQSPDEFDVIVTDHTMPHMTGYDMACRMLEIRPEVSIIICTGYSETLSPEIVAESGIKALLYKPFNKKEIAETIRKALDA